MSTAELERLPTLDLGLPAAAGRSLVRRGRPQLEVVRDDRAAGDVSCLFAARRPCDSASTVLALRGAAELDPRASTTAWIVWEGLEQLGPVGRRRVLDGWRAHRHDRLGAQITGSGCEVEIGGVPVTGELRLALLRWLPLADSELAVYEGGLFRGTPAKALTLLIRPPTIWAAAEAVAAARLYPGGPRFEPERFAALEEHALGRVRKAHVGQLRDAAARIEAQLPAAGLPEASSVVAAGRAVLTADDEWCAAIAARQLARYATSQWVAREAREGASR
jgi:hypothetical protein